MDWSRISAEKIKRRLWREVVSRTRNTSLYPYIYASYWHSLLRANKGTGNEDFYFSARPNPGAGIGHQIANWIAGYWWTKQFGLKFAHIPFSNPAWENLLGFGQGELSVSGLIKSGYKPVRLPLFDEFKKPEVHRVKKIIASYAGHKVVFVCEQDQYYKAQHGVIDDIQHKFYTNEAHRAGRLIFNKESYNIAVHVRRGDIVIGQKNRNLNLLQRWQNNDYFVNVLKNVLQQIKPEKPVDVYLFSQGAESDFTDFKQFPNLHYCLDMNARDSFLHMVYADLLITSKSSFSYKPALLNRGIKVCPSNFWHEYPESNDWVVADEHGDLEIKESVVL